MSTSDRRHPVVSVVNLHTTVLTPTSLVSFSRLLSNHHSLIYVCADVIMGEDDPIVEVSANVKYLKRGGVPYTCFEGTVHGGWLTSPSQFRKVIGIIEDGANRMEECRMNLGKGNKCKSYSYLRSPCLTQASHPPQRQHLVFSSMYSPTP